MDSIKEIKDYIEKNFSEKRKIHTEGVRTTAIELAKRYGADPQKAEIAALFHDMYRGVSENSLNYFVKHLGLDSKYLNNCNLAHGKIAAIIMQRDFEIEDPDIINAVSYHTTGRPGMSLLKRSSTSLTLSSRTVPIRASKRCARRPISIWTRRA